MNQRSRIGIALAVLALFLPGCGLFDGGPTKQSGEVVLLLLTPIASTENVYVVGLTHPDGREATGVWEIEYEVTQGSWRRLGSRQTNDTLVIPLTFVADGITPVVTSHTVIGRRGAVTTTLAVATVPF